MPSSVRTRSAPSRPACRPRPGTWPMTTASASCTGFSLSSDAAAAGHVGRIGAMQHQALAAAAHDFVEQPPQCVAAPPRRLRHGLPAAASRPAAPDRCERDARSSKRLRPAGQVEDHVAHLPPGRIVRRRAPHRARQRVEAAAPEPELAVQRRSTAGASVNHAGARNRHAAAKAQRAAPSQRARTPSSFSLTQPAGRVDAGVGASCGQQQRQRRGCGAAATSGDAQGGHASSARAVALRDRSPIGPCRLRGREHAAHGGRSPRAPAIPPAGRRRSRPLPGAAGSARRDEIADLLQRRRIVDRRQVARVAALAHRLDRAAQQLARARLGQHA